MEKINRFANDKDVQLVGLYYDSKKHEVSDITKIIVGK